MTESLYVTGSTSSNVGNRSRRLKLGASVEIPNAKRDESVSCVNRSEKRGGVSLSCFGWGV